MIEACELPFLDYSIHFHSPFIQQIFTDADSVVVTMLSSTIGSESLSQHNGDADEGRQVDMNQTVVGTNVITNRNIGYEGAMAWSEELSMPSQRNGF